MFSNLNENQSHMIDAVQKFATQEIEPFAGKWSEDKYFPVETLRKAAALGLASLNVSEEFGGLNLDRYTSHLLFIELAKYCPCTSAYLSIHNMVSWVIDTFASPAIKEKYLPNLNTMEFLASYCLTEPGSGSDAASMKSTASLKGNQYILNGQKMFISGAPQSQIYLSMVKIDNKITAVLIDKDFAGITFGNKERKMGWNAQDTSAVFFDNTPFPRENILGEIGDGFKIAMQALDRGRINIAACSLGGAEFCLQKTIQYMTEREQFGEKLSNFQALRFKVANMKMELEAAKLLVGEAAKTIDRKSTISTEACAMAKRKATDVGFMVANEAMQIHGGYGYLTEYQIERYVRDLRVHQILEGTNEIMQLIIARKIFD